jgi:hypothetical protein
MNMILKNGCREATLKCNVRCAILFSPRTSPSSY